MQTSKISRIYKIITGGVLVILALSPITESAIASPNEQTIPTAPPPTSVITPSTTPTSPGQPTAIATVPRQSTTTQSKAATASPTFQGYATSTVIEPSATSITDREMTPLVTGTAVPFGETLTATTAQERPTGTVIAVSTGGGIRGVGTSALVAGLVLLLVAGVVWWVRSRRTDTLEKNH